jgi:murein DD-endopeptidase MepM/ murein hydrolase activator NlpD
MSPAPVPKPANAGPGNAAVADTKSTFANVRNGPGTTYTDIGDIRDKTLVRYYPASNQSGWVWVEQFTTAGWVSTSVVNFNEVDAEPPTDFPPTPYDGRVLIWHWKGQVVSEQTIAQIAANVKKNTPNVTGLLVKVGDGSAWQGDFDSGDMAVNGPSDIARWVQTLAQFGLEFHAWSVLKGVEIDGEADIIIKTCNVPGVKSFILDVEPFENYWEVGPEPIRPLMTKVRQGVPPNYHIGMAVDPRRAHYKTVFPDEWFPFVDSIHTMNYWRTFRRTVHDTFAESVEVWGGFGKPLIPILQGASASVTEQKRAVSLATTKYEMRGLTWWRYGVISQWDAVNIPVEPPETNEPGDTPPPNTVFGQEVLIFPGEDGYRSGTYTGQQEFKAAAGAFGWTYFYTSTEPTTSKVWVEYKTILPTDGLYEISAFIPARHATTKKARYKVHGMRGTNTEVIIDLNQSIYRNEWVPLGIFDLVKNQTNAGKVFLNDVTGESGREIAFDALRLRQLIRVETDDDDVVVDPGIPVADGFDPPVGTAQERAGSINTSNNYWFGEWRDATGFGRDTVPGYISSQRAYHTGADLNWRFGNADIGRPVYASASGQVIYQASLRPWGNLTIIRHDPLFTATGPVYYTRYGHMQNVRVKVGQRVERGQQIGEIGTGGGNWIAHLHFDVVRGTMLENKPGDWPRLDISRLERDYIEPRTFIINHRPR